MARDFRGLGATPPDPRWPGGARLAVQLVLNYEEGGERSILDGDEGSESFLAEHAELRSVRGARSMNVESLYEYGSRAGFWRLHRLLTARGVPVTVFGVTTALERNPEAVAAMREAGWEIACHGLRWIDYQHVDETTERAHLRAAVEGHTRVTGTRPLGWYTGRVSPRTRDLVVEEGGFLYDSDSYADDLPYWVTTPRGPHLVVPYALDTNDMRYATLPGIATGDDFATYVRDAFDTLWAEGETAPRMLSIGLHCRITGRPGRTAGLARLLDHVLAHDAVWVTRRIDIARHWHAHHRP